MAKQEVPKSIRASLYIDGKPAQNSMKNVEQVARTLRKELNGLTIGTTEWNAKMKELQVHQRTLNGIKDEIRGVGGAFGFLKTELGKIGSIAAGYLGLQMLTSQFQNVVSGNARLSDSLADIRRVAEMTEEQVRRLDKSFGDLDTRTSRTELRGIAFIAGKMGVAKDEILGFVEATDKLVVSLGDELGNADQVTTQLGKILNVFDGKVDGDNITHLGNAMVKLANDGVASAGFISDFTQRVSGMAKTSGMSLGSVLGLGAGLEEMGARVESSATAIQKLIVTMGQDIPGSAKVAGMSVDSFNALFARAPQEALVRYAEGLTQNKAAFSEVAAAFKDAGEEGVRVIETLTKIGERGDFMREKIRDGNAAILETTEINAAFAIMNETMGAKLDKLGKSFESLTTNSDVMDFLVKFVDGAINAVRWIERNTEGIKTFTKVIMTAVVAWTAYNVIGKVVAITNALIRTSSLLAALAQATLTGNTVRAAAAMRLLNIAFATSPLGWVAAGIAGISAALYLFNGRLTDAQRNVRNLTDANKEAEKSVLAERLEIERALETLTENNTLLDDKFKAINALRKLMPHVLKDYSDEEIMAGKATTAIKEHTASILERAKANAYHNKVQSIQEDIIDLEDQKRRGRKGSTFKERASTFWATAGDGHSAESYESEIQRRIDAKNAESGILVEKAKEVISFKPGSTSEVEIDDVPNIKPKPGKDKKAPKEKVDPIKKAQEDLRKWLQKNQEDIYIDSLLAAGKEFAQIDRKYDAQRDAAHDNAELLEEIESQRIAEYSRLDDKIAEEAKKKANELINSAAEASDKISVGGMTERERELYSVEQHYEELLRLAEEFGLDSTAIVQRFEDAKKELTTKNDKKDKDDAEQEAQEDRERRFGFALEAAHEVSDAVFSIQKNSRRAESDARISSLEKSRDRELSNENLTQEQRKAINDKFDAQIKTEKKRAFEADKKASISQAIINGLLGASQLWIKPGFPAAIPMAAMLAGQTAASIAVMASQKAPEYALGGFSDEDPQGYVSNATLFNNSASGRPFVAGEAGREWIAPNWMVTDPKFANIIGMLETARQSKRMFAAGGSTQVDDASSTRATPYDFRNIERLMEQMIEAFNTFKGQKPTFVYKEFEEFESNIKYTRKAQGMPHDRDY